MKSLLIGGAILAVAATAVVTALILPGPGPATRPAGSPRPNVGTEIERRLVSDDTLPPPQADAPPAEWRAYERVIENICRGRDPLAKGVRPPSMQPEEMRRRLDERRKTAEARYQELRDQVKARAEQGRRKAEEKAKRFQDRPTPTPLFTPEPLPEPVSGARDPREDR